MNLYLAWANWKTSHKTSKFWNVNSGDRMSISDDQKDGVRLLFTGTTRKSAQKCSSYRHQRRCLQKV